MAKSGKLTQRELAEALGISQPAVAAAKRKGMPTDSIIGARRWRAENIDQMRAKSPDETVAELRRRKLHAETLILESKAKAPRGVVAIEAIERALFAFRPAARGAIDALHPKLIERADEFCPPRDPRHAAWFGDSYRIGRAVFGDVWIAAARAFVAEVPELKAWFLADAAKERGRAPGDA